MYWGRDRRWGLAVFTRIKGIISDRHIHPHDQGHLPDRSNYLHLGITYGAANTGRWGSQCPEHNADEKGHDSTGYIAIIPILVALRSRRDDAADEKNVLLVYPANQKWSYPNKNEVTLCGHFSYSIRK